MPTQTEIVLTLFNTLTSVYFIHQSYTAKKDKQLEELRAKIFGFPAERYNNVIASGIGINTWMLKDDPSVIYKAPKRLKPTPPYNYWAWNSLVKSYGKPMELLEDDKIQEKHSDDDNMLIIGGATISEEIDRTYKKWEDILPYKFIPRTKLNDLPSKFANAPLEITRYYLDKKEEPEGKKELVFQKTSTVDRFLCRGFEPLGPHVNESRKIEEDIILLSVLPYKHGRRIVIVNPCFGGGLKAANILNNIEVLKEIKKLIEANNGNYSQPWFQAYFSVKVEHLSDRENYSDPLYIDGKYLGSKIKEQVRT